MLFFPIPKESLVPRDGTLKLVSMKERKDPNSVRSVIYIAVLCPGRNDQRGDSKALPKGIYLRWRDVIIKPAVIIPVYDDCSELQYGLFITAFTR